MCDKQAKERLAPKPKGAAETAKPLREESRWLAMRASRLSCAPLPPNIDGVENEPREQQSFRKRRLAG